jgi:hypothetical protein
VLTRFWDAVRSMVQEEAPPVATEQSLPVSDLSVTDPARVRDLLVQLVNSRLPLALQGEGSADLGTATVFAVAGSHVMLQRNVQTGHTIADTPLRVNAAGSSPQGALMFTLQLQPSRLSGLWRAPLPAELLCVQSRRHRRIEVFRSVRHTAQLRLANGLPQGCLFDLAEEGAGLRMPECPQASRFSEGGVLLLDGVELRVPTIRLVHARTVPTGEHHVGLGFQGMDHADARTMRRWLNAAEVTSIGPA